jgi:ribosomal protein L32
MAVPKKKTSQARRDQRRAHHAMKKLNLVACPNCGEPHMPHRVRLLQEPHGRGRGGRRVTGRSGNTKNPDAYRC